MKIDPKQTLPLKSALIYGASRAGKTRFCATYPRMAWIGSLREDGYQTILNMAPAEFYDGTPPDIFGVSSIEEAMKHLVTDIIPKAKAGVYKSICLELTFYADDVMRTMPIDDKNSWAKYANLEDHVMRVDALLKPLPVRVVYNALALPSEDAKQKSGILIPGKALAKKLPALTSLVGYMHAESDENGKPYWMMSLSPFGNFVAGHRYGAKLPDQVRNPTFRDLEDLVLGKATADENGVVTRGAPAPLPKLAPIRK